MCPGRKDQDLRNALFDSSLEQRWHGLACKDSQERYNHCLWQGQILDLWRRIRGKATELRSLEAVTQNLHAYQRIARGILVVPVQQITGSVGRTHDFTCDFLPRPSAERSRWIELDKLAARDAALPPVQLYKLSENYFVLNGHHRISVARANQILEIDAQVVELLGVDTQPQPIIEHAEVWQAPSIQRRPALS